MNLLLRKWRWGLSHALKGLREVVERWTMWIKTKLSKILFTLLLDHDGLVPGADRAAVILSLQHLHWEFAVCSPEKANKFAY